MLLFDVNRTVTRYAPRAVFVMVSPKGGILLCSRVTGLSAAIDTNDSDTPTIGNTYFPISLITFIPAAISGNRSILVR